MITLLQHKQVMYGKDASSIPIDQWEHSHYRDLNLIAFTLWPDISVAKTHLQDTLAAISLKYNHHTSLLEIVPYLLNKKKDPKFHALEPKQSDAFWHLTFDERLILIGLHFLKWNTEQLGQLLGLPPVRIEALAWLARLEIGPRQLYPLPPLKKTKTCPPYDLKHPWTQRFLDPKPPHFGHHFTLEQHLCACSSCKAALDRCRTFYFSIQKQLERLMPHEPEKKEWDHVRNEIQRRPTLDAKRSLPFWTGLKQFLNQWDTRALLAAFCLISILKFLGFLV